MSADASKRMSVEQEAREKNQSFWEVEDAAATSGAERPDDEQGQEDDPEYNVEGGEDDTTTSDGGNHTDSDLGGSNPATPAAPKKKKQRKDRTPQSVDNATDVFTEVTASGQPVAPEKLAAGYGMQLGCILRESVSINTKDLRSKANEALVEHLLKRVHQRYTFPLPLNKKVDSLAITKMSTALSSWKTRVKSKIEKGDSWEEISKKDPHITEEEFEEFKLSLKSEEAEKWTKWGKDMRELNLGNHHLGSGGYRGKKPIWEKEDREIARLGKENHWEKILDEQTRNFVRSRYYLDWETGEFITDYEDVKEFQKKLVREFNYHIYISQSPLR